MSRNHSLSDLVGNSSDPAKGEKTATQSRSDYVKRGASRAMQHSLGDLAESAKLVAKGDVIVSLDPRLIDASFFEDRIEDDEHEYSDLLEAIKQDGFNSTPILVRPHPDKIDRYMIVYGHRRWKVAGELGIKVRAVVKSVEDLGHIIAQGQENSARSNLSFIEKSMAAANLIDMGQSRETIKKALSVDDALLSRLLSVSQTVDREIIFSIGAAKKIGRDRWEELKRLVANPAISKTALEVILSPEFTTLSSNDRFDHLLKTLKETGRSGRSRAKGRIQKTTWTSSDKSLAAEMQRSTKSFQLNINSNFAEGFGDFIAQNLDGLFEAYQTRKENDE